MMEVSELSKGLDQQRLPRGHTHYSGYLPLPCFHHAVHLSGPRALGQEVRFWAGSLPSSGSSFLPIQGSDPPSSLLAGRGAKGCHEGAQAQEQGRAADAGEALLARGAQEALT